MSMTTLSLVIHQASAWTSPIPLKDKIQRSDVIVRIKVVSVDDFPGTKGQKGTFHSIAKCVVEKLYKGKFQSSVDKKVKELLNAKPEKKVQYLFIPCNYDISESPSDLQFGKEYIAFLYSLKNALIAHPVHPFALHMIVNGKVSAKGLGHGEKAAEKTSTVEGFERDISILVGMEAGEKYMRGKSYAKAKKEFLTVTELSPENAFAWEWAGIAARNSEEYDDAIKYLKKAIEITPDKIKIYGNLGAIYKKQGKYDNAIVNFKKVIELDENEIWAIAPLVEIYFKKRDINECSVYIDMFDNAASAKTMTDITEGEKRKIEGMRKKFALLKKMMMKREGR